MIKNLKNLQVEVKQYLHLIAVHDTSAEKEH